jgi:quinohemoprotein ethanol dehydrogenase
MKKLVLLFSAAVLILGSIAFITKTIPGTPLHIAKVVGAVQDQQIAGVDDNSGDWLTYGRNYGEERFSPLGQITKDNVSQLGLAWSLNLGTKRLILERVNYCGPMILRCQKVLAKKHVAM